MQAYRSGEDRENDRLMRRRNALSTLNGKLKGAYGAHSNGGAAAFVPMHGEPWERLVCSS